MSFGAALVTVAITEQRAPPDAVVENAHLVLWLDIASSSFGVVSAIILGITAVRAAPLQRLLDDLAKVSGDKIAEEIVRSTNVDLRRVRVLEGPFLKWGFGFLFLSFLLDLLKHFV